ncbi:feruloyl-CoA synthase [Pseudosulfitobacter koreensis]|uniref:Feruloyl-CoA synthase n=1 Tax=Pseudosulfitobacter koreensis TaxID=2968472 RepID=A0ABT1Z3Z7_9RHOB|nr:feruloyl-CoA synthase [Pseudosulfitobacter koreense]MCR8827828.1 feruloyl-CoA synthase [Pseudosulfitobacter koreense]
MNPPRFWAPTFDYETRADGTILMRQQEPLPTHPQLLADYLDHWASVAPDRTWIARRKDGGDWQRVSYAQARDKARRLGAALLDLGLGHDRPLLILSENSLEHALLGLAAVYVGVPYAPLATAYSLVSEDHGKIREIAALLNPGAVFADDGAAYARAVAAIAADGRAVINARDPAEGALSFDTLLDHAPDDADAARAALTPDTVAKYLFTSGSTGAPKAVINTNAMICSSQAMVRDCYRFLTDQPPVVLDWAPWNHTAAGNKVSYLVLTNGGTYYIDDGRPAGGKFAETLRNLRDISCTWYFNVPVGYDMLVEALETDDHLARTFFADLGMLFYAGASMSQRTWDRLSAIGRKVTGRDVLLATGLGATETAPFALAITDVQDRSGNVGVPARGLTLKLVPNAGKLEARLKGPSIMPGYYGDVAKSAEVFDDEGFYCLGDALRPADPDDFSKGFFFDGRLAENFKLTTGTWVAVGAVRAALVDAMDGLIRDAVIVGEDQAQLGALLWLSDKAAAMNADDLSALLQDRLRVAASNATGSASRIRRAVVLNTPPGLDAGEITEKGSLNQRALRAGRTALISRLYAGEDGVIIA